MSTKYKYKSAYLNKQRNAFKRGLAFTLTYEEYSELRESGKCAYTGMDLKTRNSSSSTSFNDFTVERIDSNKGYVTGNVIPCSYIGNNLKAKLENTVTDLEFIHLVKFLFNVKKHGILHKINLFKQKVLTMYLNMWYVNNNIPIL